MLKNFSFWIKAAAVLQILTGLIHSLSFLNDPQATNDTERQLVGLMSTYRMDMGAGFNPTMSDLFTSMSACFALLYLFAAWINFYLLRKNIGSELWKGLLNIQRFVFGISFVVMVVFTFLPPIVLTGLVFVCLAVARMLAPKS